MVEVFRNQLHANLIYVDATERFLGKLENVANPEQKRKIIGGEFIRVFEEEARKLDGIKLSGQGTIYPDLIESKTGSPGVGKIPSQCRRPSRGSAVRTGRAVKAAV